MVILNKRKPNNQESSGRFIEWHWWKRRECINSWIDWVGFVDYFLVYKRILQWITEIWVFL